MNFNLWSEYRFRVLWYFVAFAFGCALYFGLPKEPDIIMCLVLSGCLLCATYFRRKVWVKLAFFFVFGVTVATVRTYFVDTEFMIRPQWKKEISGKVVESFATHSGQMVVLENVQMPQARFIPKRVRLSFKKEEPKLREGDEIYGLVNLFGPETYQAQRFFYQGLSAQGQLLQLLTHKHAEVNLLNDIRLSIMERLRLSLTPSQWEIAVPLLIGEQGVVSKEVYALYRKAGIAHVLSVSGFHMMLLATFVFFLVRGFLALFPYLALRLPTKKIAAVVAFGVTGLYLLISGMQVPAIRSFMMISLVFLGVLTDRKVVSLYTLCLVAFGMLLIRPEWIVSVSFQLSFMAVMVLVGVFEDVSKHLPKGLFCRVVVTGFIANILVTLALAPFVAYHFNQFNPYGAIGNLLTSVLFSFFIMPLLFISAVLMPFHWEGPVLKCVGFMLDKVTFLAEKVSSWAGSEIIVPTFSPWCLGFVALGIVFLCVMKSKVRFLGLFLILIVGVFGFCLMDSPDIVVLKQGKVILARQNNTFIVVKGNKKDWLVQRFIHQQGQSEVVSRSFEILQIGDYKIALSSQHCEGADLAILSKENESCRAKMVFVPTTYSPYEIFLKRTILVHELAKDVANRPWSVQYQRKEKK